MAIEPTRATTGDAIMASILEEFGERATKPGKLSPEGDGQDVLNQGMTLELMALTAKLRTRRAAMGLTLAQVARRSRLTVDAIERLESGENRNPHFDLVWRYALAMDAYPTLSIEEVEPGDEEVEDRVGE